MLSRRSDFVSYVSEGPSWERNVDRIMARHGCSSEICSVKQNDVGVRYCGLHRMLNTVALEQQD